MRATGTFTLGKCNFVVFCFTTSVQAYALKVVLFCSRSKYRNNCTYCITRSLFELNHILQQVDILLAQGLLLSY